MTLAISESTCPTQRKKKKKERKEERKTTDINALDEGREKSIPAHQV